MVFRIRKINPARIRRSSTRPAGAEPQATLNHTATTKPDPADYAGASGTGVRTTPGQRAPINMQRGAIRKGTAGVVLAAGGAYGLARFFGGNGPIGDTIDAFKRPPSSPPPATGPTQQKAPIVQALESLTGGSAAGLLLLGGVIWLIGAAIKKRKGAK